MLTNLEVRPIQITLIFLLPFVIRAQNVSESSLALIALKESLPAYLNTHPASIASFSSEGRFYKVFSAATQMMPPRGETNDRQDSILGQWGTELENANFELKHIADSIDEILKNHKIYLIFSDKLDAYRYKPKEDEDLRLKEEWEAELEYLKEDFEINEMHRLDSAIGIEYVYLIKKQIDNELHHLKIDPSVLNNSYYEYVSKAPSETDPSLIIRGLQVYLPVFNFEKNKGCYLVSYAGDGAVFYDFVFIQEKNGHWILVESYPGHLIHRE